MGKVLAAPPAYRDDGDAVSLHTTPDDYDYDAPEASGLPPSYTFSDADSTTITVPTLHHVTPSSTRTNHNSPSFKNGKPTVCETQDMMDSKLDTDPVALEAAIRANAEFAPTPYIYIMGTHTETVKRGDKKETQHITDFRIVLNMRRYLHNNFNALDATSMAVTTVENGVKTHRGTILKCRAPGVKQDIEVGTEKPTLTEWCHRYCASPRMLKIFRLERTVPGLDREYLKNRIEGLVAATNYRGNVSVTFPVEDRYLDMYTCNKINQWRLKNWICWIFYLTFLWIFTWPYLFFMTKRYSVVRAEWPFSITYHDGSKKYTTVSEEQWFEKWNMAVRRLVLDRYQGEASEQMMEGVIARPADPPMPGTVNCGHAGVDNAVGILTQGFQVASALRNGSSIGGSTQGGWGYDT